MNDLIIDAFAGGGGASVGGIKMKDGLMECRQALLNCFPDSFFNDQDEFITSAGRPQN